MFIMPDIKVKFGHYTGQVAIGPTIMWHHGHVDLIFELLFWYVEITIGDEQ